MSDMAQEATEEESTENKEFYADYENMDLTKIHTETFLVGVSTGSREKAKMICTTMRGPFSFYEMVDVVGAMWKENNHHAKIHILSKDFKEPANYLDENTTDYIETKFEDLLVEEFLTTSDEEYTCEVGVLSESDEEE